MAAELIAIIGAGGKTTALRQLAIQNADRSVLITTTTHIFPIEPPESRTLLVYPSAQELEKALSCPGIVCAGRKARDGKLGCLSEDALGAARRRADIILYEGDGAHCHPLKLHRQGEPVILSGTDRCLIVAGLTALGMPVGEGIHRYALRDEWKAAPHRPIDREELLACILETVRASGLPQERLYILLNQEDALADRAKVDWSLQRLRKMGLNARAGSLFKDPQLLKGWVTD